MSSLSQQQEQPSASLGSGGAHLFARVDQAAHYSLHRPRYPEQLYEAVLSKCAGRSLAVDVATGTGQAATSLAGYFNKVVALDGSAQQLQHADRQHANVEYQQADAHSTGLPDACADLVTVAQALHWFDYHKFYKEVRRVLKPSGCFAAWTYALPTLCHKGHPANAVLWQLYQDVLGEYWAAGRKHVEQQYVGIEPVQGEDFAYVERLSFESPAQATVDDLVGYIKSWSAYHAYLEQHPQSNVIVGFQRDLLNAVGAQDGSQSMDIIWEITLVLAKDPMPLMPQDHQA